jgi:hypothetical protein
MTKVEGFDESNTYQRLRRRSRDWSARRQEMFVPMRGDHERHCLNSADITIPVVGDCMIQVEGSLLDRVLYLSVLGVCLPGCQLLRRKEIWGWTTSDEEEKLGRNLDACGRVSFRGP